MYSLASAASKLMLYANKQMSGNEGQGGLATTTGASSASPPPLPLQDGDPAAAAATTTAATAALSAAAASSSSALPDLSWVDERGIRHYPPTGSHIPSDPVMGLPQRRFDGKEMDVHWCLWAGRTEMELRVFVTPFPDWDTARDWPDAWPDNYRYLRAHREQWRRELSSLGGAHNRSSTSASLASGVGSGDGVDVAPAAAIASAAEERDRRRKGSSKPSGGSGGGGGGGGGGGVIVDAPWPPLPAHSRRVARSRLLWHVPDLVLETDFRSKEKKASAKAAAAALTRALELNYSLPDAVRRDNASAFAHVFLTHRGAPLDRLQSDWFERYPDNGGEGGDGRGESGNPHQQRAPSSSSAVKETNPSAAFLRPFDARLVQHQRYDMTKFSVAPKHRRVVSLLGGDAEADAATADMVEKQEAEGGPGLVSKWKPTLELHLVQQFASFRGGRHAIPAPVASAMTFDYASGAYYPILYRSEFWLMAKHHLPIANVSTANATATATATAATADASTTTAAIATARATSADSSSSSSSSSSPPPLPPLPPRDGDDNDDDLSSRGEEEQEQDADEDDEEAVVPLSLSFSMMSLWKWQTMSQMEHQWREQERQGLTKEGESDVVRQLLLDTDPVLLVVTGLVSALHMLFEFLAFSNDVSFFRRRKDFTGLSIRSMLLQCFFQTVILLYLFDNDTSWVVLLSSSVGLAIEYWKVSKALRLEFTGGALSWRDVATLRFLRLKERDGANYAQSRTQEYDKIAPLVVGYSAFALTHYKYKSWYSWIVSSLVSFIYAFGFVMMTPQLFINYKLQSVAHLPWKAMIYKSLNTFIDDLFAFVIKMPLMHRLACLRDDVIFVVFLYQRWIYRTDMARVNEFGQEFVADEGKSTIDGGGGGGNDGHSTPTLPPSSSDSDTATTSAAAPHSATAAASPAASKVASSGSVRERRSKRSKAT